MQKRARASLSLRLPRSRPSAVGVDSSFFNITPPSVEDSTHEKEAAKPAITESVEGSVAIEARSPSSGTPKDLQSPDRFVLAERPDINPNPHSWVDAALTRVFPCIHLTNDVNIVCPPLPRFWTLSLSK